LNKGSKLSAGGGSTMGPQGNTSSNHFGHGYTLSSGLNNKKANNSQIRKQF